MSCKLSLDDRLQGATVFVLVGLGNGADLAVGAIGEDGANGELLRPGLGFGSAMEFSDISVDRLWENRGRLFLSSGSEDHEVHALRLG